MQQCETDYDCSREGDVCIIVRAPSERAGLNGRIRSNNQKICIGTWLIYAADFDEPRTGGGLKHYTDDIFFKRGRRVPQQYVGFVEDMMLVLFLVCILVTLITVHRASCYRQFQDARRNSPLRHILPIGDDQPPPYSERQDSVDGGLAEVVTEPNAPKRQSETPPPSYEEALYRNSVQLPEESEARTNMATDYLNDLDCLPSYSETRIRIIENLPQVETTQTTTTTTTTTTTNTTTQDQPESCTEQCTLLAPIHTSTNIVSSPTPPTQTPPQTLEVEGVPSTSQPPTPTESILSGPLPTNLAPQVQVVTEASPAACNIIGSTTKLNIIQDSETAQLHNCPLNNNIVVDVIDSSDNISAIISDKSQQAFA